MTDDMENIINLTEVDKEQQETTTNLPTVTNSSLGGATLTPDQLRAAVASETEKRAIIVDFVKSQLKDGVDYGKIHINKECQNKWQCKIPYHWSKDNLFKPGMEKILSLMNLQSTLERDEGTIEMLKATGWNKPTIAFICTLSRNGQTLAEGRGAAEVGQGGKDVNSSLKIAEKRARMDACLSLGFSEFFTQDAEAETIHETEPPSSHIQRAEQIIDAETGEIVEPKFPEQESLTDKQLSFLRELLIKKAAVRTAGDAKKVFVHVGIDKDRAEDLTKEQARDVIDFLLKHEALDIAMQLTETENATSDNGEPNGES